MVLLTQAPPRESERFITQPAPPISAPIDRGWADWGMAIGICILVGHKLLGIFTQQQSAESKMFMEHMQASERREQRAEAREERLYQLIVTLTQPKA